MQRVGDNAPCQLSYCSRGRIKFFVILRVQMCLMGYTERMN